MTILVLGDSFADCKTWNHDNNPSAWPNILSKILNTDVTSIGVSGSSLEYSYKQFLKTYNPNIHKIVIFLRTECNRRHLVSVEGFDVHYPFMEKNTQYNEFITHKHITTIRKGLETSDIFFEDTNDWKLGAITDAIHFKMNGNRLINIDLENMSEISNLDHNYYNLDRKNSYDTDTRPCHMNVIQNKTFAEYMSLHIQNEKSIYDVLNDIGSFFTPAVDFKSTGLHIIGKNK